jgi:hypothetical protein
MNGFVSYSHDDFQAFKAFQTHLRAVERAFGISFWSDQRIDAGYHWNSAIQNKIETSDVFVLLVSPDFIASDYIYDKEIPAIRRRKKAGGALVLPLILARCSWTWLCGELQSVPTYDGRLKPVAAWKPQADGFDRAREEITASVQSYYGLTPRKIRWTGP